MKQLAKYFSKYIYTSWNLVFKLSRDDLLMNERVLVVQND